MDKITIQIRCSSETCENLRDHGMFFETIAEVLDINRNDIVEIKNKVNEKEYDKS